MNKRIISSVFVLSFVVSACGGGGGGSDDPGTTPSGSEDKIAVNSISQIEGFWNATETRNGVQDVDYEYVSSSGVFTSYDYMGDSFDRGDNCYAVELQSVDDYTIFTPGSGDGSFYIIDLDEGVTTTTDAKLYLNSDSTVLTIEYEDSFDEDGDGNTKEFLTTVWTKEEGAVAADYSPVCGEVSNPPASNIVETNVSDVRSALVGNWVLSEQQIVYSSSYTARLEGMVDVVGALAVGDTAFGEAIGLVNQEAIGIGARYSVVAYNQMTITDEFGCTQTVGIGISPDHQTLAMAYPPGQCNHAYLTTNVWSRSSGTSSRSINKSVDTVFKAEAAARRM